MRFNLSARFPVLTTKKLHLRSIPVELLRFLRRDTNVRWLHEQRCAIRDEWADANGNLGPVYGKQWHNWETADRRHIDPIAGRIDMIRTSPVPYRAAPCRAAPRRRIVTS
jgi:thymidylate synthase